MHVRSGADPRHQDDKVRFRTTHYFRVFDVCRDSTDATTRRTPLLDSLYRFRMTGKASGLTQVRFDSGILHKAEMDPFGSSVVFDDSLDRHQFVSREETNTAAQRHGRYEEISRQLELLKDLDRSVQQQGGEVLGSRSRRWQLFYWSS